MICRGQAFPHGGILISMILLAITGLFSCCEDPESPGNPALKVSPESLSIEYPDGTGTFWIRNTGEGTLEWHICTESHGWLVVDSGEPCCDGSIHGEGNYQVVCTINWDEISPGEQKTAEIPITTNAGNASVSIIATYHTDPEDNSLAEETMILTSDDIDEIESYDEGSITLSDSAYVAANIQVGDILVSGISDVAPYGFVRRVESISYNEKGLGAVVRTVTAAIEEAFSSCDYQTTGTVLPDGFVQGFNNEVLYDSDGNLSTTDDQVVLNGSLSFDHQYRFELAITDFVTQRFVFSNTLSEEATAELTVRINETISEEHTLYTVPLPPFTVTIPTVPPFPIVFTPEIEINAGVVGNLAVGGTFEAIQEATLEAGISYDRNGSPQWTLIGSFDNSFAFEYGNLQVDAEIEGYVGPELVLYAYGSGAGVSAEINATTRLNINLLQRPWLEAYGGLEARVGAELEFLGRTISDYETTVLVSERLIFDTGDEDPDPEGQRPETTIVDYSVSGNTAEFEFIGDDPDGTVVQYKYRVDGSQWDYTELTEATIEDLEAGEHLFEVSAQDDTDLWDLSPAQQMFHIGGSSEGVIAFVGGGGIHTMNIDGSNRIRLTHNLDDGNPSWFPDGSKITFLRYSSIPETSSIYIMNADGSNLSKLTDLWCDSPSAPSWSPDGTRVAFEAGAHQYSGYDIFIMNADGTGQINLTNSPEIEVEPNWSPDGLKIAYTAVGSTSLDVFVMNADGTDSMNLSDAPGGNAHPAWSPDGTAIAFQSFRDGNWEIYTMDASGTNQVNVTNHPGTDKDPSWSPDGTRIAFVSARDGDNQIIYIMNADGTNQVGITTGVAFAPAWAPIP